MEVTYTPNQWSEVDINFARRVVKNGAEWLDKVYPEWWMVINTQTLRIDSACHCIWGQIIDTGDEVYVEEDEQDVMQWLSGWGMFLHTLGTAVGPSRTSEFIFSHGFVGARELFDPLWVEAIKHRVEVGRLE